MTWPIPTTKAIFDRMAATLEAALTLLKPDVDPTAISRSVRSARGTLAAVNRVHALEARSVHDHISWVARQVFPDTVDDEEMIFRHAGIWGVPQRPAVAAIGSVLIEGIAGTALPADLQFSASDASSFLTSTTATIGDAGSVTVEVRAATAGTAGNIEAGIKLVTVTPFPEITRVTVAEPGLAGGADEQSPTDLQSDVLARIRQAPHGGAGFDYPVWVKAAFDIKAIAIVPAWIGRGSVGVIVAMRDGDGEARVPTDDECDAILAYLGPLSSQTGVKPVTAHIVVVPCTLQPVPISVRLRPDTIDTRAAVTDAFARYIETLGDADDPQNASPIGARIEPSRISEAISAAGGEYAHDLTVPAAPYTLAAAQFPTAGAITFLEAI